MLINCERREYYYSAGRVLSFTSHLSVQKSNNNGKNNVYPNNNNLASLLAVCFHPRFKLRKIHTKSVALPKFDIFI